MSRNDSATKQDLNEGRAEALHALLNSLSPGSSTGANGGKLSTDQVRQLSDKLSEILGENSESGEGARRNEKGELLNEEGLPIIDINEPVTAADYAFRPDPNNPFDDPDLLPLWTLSDEEKARRKAERERILDLLEEEEQTQQTRNAELTRRRLEEELEKRRDAAKEDMDKLKKARELQKKLGKALIRSVVESRDQAEKEKADQEEQDRLAASARPLKAKKSVSFAETSPEEIQPPGAEGKGKDVDWGDVTPGTLRKPDPSASRADRPVMKMHVVERHPNGSLRSPGPPARDSDDESDPENYGAQDTDDDEDYGRHDFEGRIHTPPPDSVDSEEDEHFADEEPSEWNDEDFDTARHQREVALEYYEKRKTIGQDVVSAMRAHTHGDEDWDQPEVPLEANLVSGPPKPSVSRFKSERQPNPPPNPTSLASHSLGAAVLPIASATSLKRAIRMGKLEGEKLVGGEEGDSEDEVTAEDESAQRLLEAILRGEVTNAGPQSSSVPIPTPATQPIETPQSSARDEVPQTPAAKPRASKVSKFKLALQQPHTMPAPVSPAMSSSVGTPSNVSERSSPKLPATYANSPVSARDLLSKHPLSEPSSRPSTSRNPHPTVSTQPQQMPSMIVDSPSFLPPRTPNAPGASPAFHSAIIEPPSFQSSIISPSPLSASSTAVPTPVSATPPAPATPSVPVAPPVRASVVERKPPSVVSQTVQERGGALSGVAAESTDRKQKVSRFKAQRS